MSSIVANPPIYTVDFTVKETWVQKKPQMGDRSYTSNANRWFVCSSWYLCER